MGAGYALGRTPGGAWRNTRYGYVGMPPGRATASAANNRAPKPLRPRRAALDDHREEHAAGRRRARTPFASALACVGALDGAPERGTTPRLRRRRIARGSSRRWTLRGGRRWVHWGRVSAQAQAPRGRQAAPPQYASNPPAGWI